MVERNRGNSGGTSSSGIGGGTSQPTTPGGKAQQQATQVKEQVQQTAADLKDQVTDQATGKIEEQKTAASGGLSTVAHAVRQTADQLEENDQEEIARYVHRAAAQVESVADYIGRRDLRGLAQDAEQFARREPALFLGGAFALGLFAARFLKSTSSTSGAASQSGVGSRGSTLALPAASSYQPRTGAASVPTAYGSEIDLATAPLAGLETDDAIVGGPPISSDIVVGGPPHKPGQEPRR